MPRQLVTSFTLIALGLLLAVQPALAARVYNLLPYAVTFGGLDGSITLAPGERSASISWGHSQRINVWFSGDRSHTYTHGMGDLCVLSFGMHAELTGGHYLIIGHDGSNVSCSLCDSDYRLMFKAGRSVPDYWEKLKGRSTKTGC